MQLMIRYQTLIYRFSHEEFNSLLQHLGCTMEEFYSKDNIQTTLGGIRQICMDWTMQQDDFKNDPMVKAVFENYGMLGVIYQGLADGTFQLILSKLPVEVVQKLMHAEQQMKQLPQNQKAQNASPNNQNGEVATTNNDQNSDVQNNQDANNTVNANDMLTAILNQYINAFMEMMAEQLDNMDGDYDYEYDGDGEDDDAFCMIADESNPLKIPAYKFQGYDNLPVVDDVEQESSCFMCLKNNKIQAFVDYLRASKPSITLAEVQASILRTICYRNFMDEVGADKQTLYTNKLLELIEKVYNSDPKVKYFYKLRSLSDGMSVVPYVQKGSIIKKNNTYYIMTYWNYPVFLEYGTISKPVFYKESEVVCNIQDGNFIIS